jgi:antibiotic biosynthesis monooxygenase (ABM) superfamily enzyme
VQQRTENSLLRSVHSRRRIFSLSVIPLSEIVLFYSVIRVPILNSGVTPTYDCALFVSIERSRSGRAPYAKVTCMQKRDVGVWMHPRNRATFIREGEELVYTGVR